MLELSWCWMERLTLISSGGRVPSWPWFHDTFAPLETEGLTNGGAVHGGSPCASVNVGGMPLLELEKVCVRVKPMLWVEPETEVMAPYEIPAPPRITVLSFIEYAKPKRGPNALK